MMTNKRKGKSTPTFEEEKKVVADRKEEKFVGQIS
jgi:hypothetical protein